MKKVYEAPEAEIELYELDASIAATCAWRLHLGPGYGDHTACDEFKDSEDDIFTKSAMAGAPSFYDDNTCSCYYSAGGESYFTS